VLLLALFLFISTCTCINVFRKENPF